MKAKKFKYSDHPSITLVCNKPKLRIFEDFCIEEKLPKFNVTIKKPVIRNEVGEKDVNSKAAYGPSIEVSSSNILSSIHLDRADSDTADTSGPYSPAEDRDFYELKRVLEGIGENVSTRSPARWDRDRYIRNKLNEIRNEAFNKKPEKEKSVFDRIKSLFIKDSKQEESELKFEYDIEESFKKIKESFVIATTEMLEKHKRIVDATIKRLEDAGQYRKADEFSRSAFVLAHELTLASDKRYAKYITEEQMIEFMLKSEKGVNIDYLRHYGELMPTEVVEKKLEADKMMIFDNYAVIHYDNTLSRFNKMAADIDEERERRRKRDPILVGLMQGSRKLYYICDWVTKEDDLTIDRVEEVIGKKLSNLEAIEHGIDYLEKENEKLDQVVRIVDDMHTVIGQVANAVDNNENL